MGSVMSIRVTMNILITFTLAMIPCSYIPFATGTSVTPIGKPDLTNAEFVWAKITMAKILNRKAEKNKLTKHVMECLITMQAFVFVSTVTAYLHPGKTNVATLESSRKWLNPRLISQLNKLSTIVRVKVVLRRTV